MGERNPLRRFERTTNHAIGMEDAAFRVGAHLVALTESVSFAQVARPNRLQSQAGPTQIEQEEPLNQPVITENGEPTVFTVGPAPESSVAAALADALLESGRVTILLHNDPDSSNL